MNAAERERLRNVPSGDAWSRIGLALKCAACIGVIGLLATIGLVARDVDVGNAASEISATVAP
jgi:hypothetical protein